MHPYSVNKDIRRSAVLGIFIVSLGLSYLIHVLVIVKIKPLEDFAIIADVSSLSIYAFLLFLFDRVIWRWFVNCKLINIPIVSGTWKGTYTSSKNDFTPVTDVDVVIKQNFFNLCVYFNNDSVSNSHSEMACFLDGQSANPVLMYEYMNEPPDKNLQIHRGTCRLIYKEQENTLIGEYYNDSHNGHWGRINLSKVN